MEQLELPFDDVKIQALADLFYRWYGFFNGEREALNWARDMIKGTSRAKLYFSEDFKKYHFRFVRSEKVKIKFIISKHKTQDRGDGFCTAYDRDERMKRREGYDPKQFLRYINEVRDV